VGAAGHVEQQAFETGRGVDRHAGRVALGPQREALQPGGLLLGLAGGAPQVGRDGPGVGV
jgi:hypothetical protein